MALSTWLAFLAATFLLSASPGPGMFNAVNTALSHGLRPALLSILGLQVGLAGVMVLVGLGVGSLLAGSPEALRYLQWLGAGYLAWLGMERWRSRGLELAGVGEGSAPAGRRLFGEALLVNLTNPKSILFFSAFFPQFLDPLRPWFSQVALMAVTSVAVDLLVMGAAAGAALRLRPRLLDTRLMRLQSRLFGTLFIAAAILAACRS